MVELAITAPIFLLIVLVAIWYGITNNQKATFLYGMGTAPRLALTRGNELTVGTQIIPEVQAWIQLGDPNPPASDVLRPLLATKDEEGGAFGNGGWYATQWGTTLGSVGTIKEIPPSYIYAIIYFYQTLKQGVGDSLRYPCAEPGCARCTNLNATTRTRAASTGTQAVLGGSGYNYDFVGLYCEFRPDVAAISPITGLINLISAGSYNPSIVFRAERYFEVAVRNSAVVNPY